MSNTPRTDAEEGWYASDGTWLRLHQSGTVRIGFARDLERELTSARIDANIWKERAEHAEQNCGKAIEIALEKTQAELARALRVVEAAKELAANCEEYEFDDGLGYAAQGMWWHDLDNALEEWEAGR